MEYGIWYCKHIKNDYCSNRRGTRMEKVISMGMEQKKGAARTDEEE